MQHFSEDVIEKARKVNLVDYLLSIGEPLKKEGKEYRLKKHDSLSMNPDTNLWKWNSRNVGGKNAIDYLMTVENMKFTEAVETLTSACGGIGTALSHPEAEQEKESKKPFALPLRAEDNRRVFAYLCKERRILPPIVNHFIKAGDLYEDAAHHNAVFVGRDERGVPRYAMKRSTNTLIPSTTQDGLKRCNRWDVEGSNKSMGFRHAGGSEKLYVFEAPIDLLSFISMRILMQPACVWRHDSYLALGGVSNRALKWFLTHTETGRSIQNLYFCLDSDVPGHAAAKELAGRWSQKYQSHILVPDGKDYNEMLKMIVTRGGKI